MQMDDSKQAAESYDQTHRVDDRDFITNTIAYVDDYLRGEQASKTQDALSDDSLCWRCGEAESEHYGEVGYCNEQYDVGQTFLQHPPEGEVWDAEADAHEWTPEDQLEYEAILDAEEREDWDHRLSKWCQVHDQELQGGKCSACVHEQEEELRNDH